MDKEKTGRSSKFSFIFLLLELFEMMGKKVTILLNIVLHYNEPI